MKSLMISWAHRFAVLVLAAMLAACGGGGGDDAGSQSAQPPASPGTVQPGDPPAQNQPPTISGAPASSVVAGQAYSFTPTASDPEGQRLSYSITNRPPWATFNTSTGQLSGKPSTANLGDYRSIRISVSDGQATAWLPGFTITVTPPPTPPPPPIPPPPANHPPIISGTPPASVTVGQAYSFTPTASDPDGQQPMFSIQNQPPWASFNTSTGRLWGTPSAADVNVYTNIRISVSDGELSANLPAFSITVADVQTGSATLSWQPPTSNTDDSPLTNLAGYRIYYGTSAQQLSRQVSAPAGVSSYVIESLSPATWYFAMTAYNSAGVESNRSAVVSKTIH